MDSKNQGGEYREDRVDIVKNGDGYAIGYTQKGEWLEYTVNVEAGGTLPYELSYATGMEKAGIQLFMDGEAITDELELKGTGDFDEYTTFKGKTTKELTKGEHVLKVQITTDYVNLDWIAFGASDKSAEEIRNGSSETPEDTIPAFVMSTPAIDARISDEYKVFDLMGHQLGKVRLEGVTTSADIKIGLRNAGYRNGAYVIRNSAGRAFRIDACK
ncbi:carbohydrate-binding protein [Fibrobacter sp. UWR4]|uniref:carbohydrate-binding protein n=1 Tax=unclassified Fibrobacter TaxID=2634177 RepID=UPI0035185917